MSNLNQILERGIDYLTRSFEESSRVIGEAIEKDGAVKITLAITVDGDELTTRFSVGKKATKMEPEKSTLDDENQLPLPEVE